jgi:hypothetical protein
LDELISEVIIKKQKVADDTLDTKHECQVEVAIKNMKEVKPEEKKEVLMEKPRGKRQIDTSRVFTKEQGEAILQGLKFLNTVCDGAKKIDGSGFNKYDSASQFIKDLCERNYLTPKQIPYAYAIVRKYKGQLGEDFMKRIEG